MPLRPEDLDFMQSYLNGAPREELQGRLDSMYGQPTPDQMQAAFGGQDPRTAQNMSGAGGTTGLDSPFAPTVENVAAAQRAEPPAPPQISTDAGGMSVPPQNASEAPAMSTVAPAELASMGQQAQSRLAAASAAEAAPEGGATPAEPGAEQTPAQRAYQRYLLGAGRPGGAYQPGGEQFAERSISRELRNPMSPETAAELEAANVDAQGLAVGQGESAAGMLEKQAAVQAQQAQQAREALSQYKRDTASKQAEYEMRQSQLEDMRAQIQQEPMTFWSGKDTGTQIMNGIGLFLLGLGSGPEAVQHVIDRDIATKQESRGKEISLLQDQLNRFKDSIPSPEAQQMYTRSLALDAAAAEMERMASTAKAEEVRQRGYAGAEELRRAALQSRAAAEMAPIGKEELKTKNMPGKWVGGGKSVEEQIIERHKKAGGAGGPLEALANAYGEFKGGGAEPQNEFELSKAKHARALSVRLPNGQEAFASTEKQKEEVQRDLQSNSTLQDIYSDLEKIRSNHAVTGQWDREAIGRVKANVAKANLALRESEKGGGGLRLNSDISSLISPLTGEGMKDWIVGDQFDSSLKRARELSNQATDQARQLLSGSPYRAQYITTPAGGQGSTFKPHAKGKE